MTYLFYKNNFAVYEWILFLNTQKQTFVLSKYFYWVKKNFSLQHIALYENKVILPKKTARDNQEPRSKHRNQSCYS